MENELKQKQIEEMAGCKDCYDSLGHCPSQDNKEICPCWKNAVENYKQGYRKIPENAVVLTKERYDELFASARRSKIKTIDLESIKIAEEKTRKETAEKFAEYVKMAFYYEFDELIPSIMADKIDEICKEITGVSKSN